MRALGGLGLVSVFVVLAGCSSAHEPVAIETGLYDLTIAGEHDACSPMRETGSMGTVAVIATGDVLSLPVPDLMSGDPMRLSLSRIAGFHAERTEEVPTCTGATLVRSYTVVDAANGGFDVLYGETWTGLPTCGTAMHSIVPAAPASDCRADLVLGYRLGTACAAPCEVRLAADGSAACACD